MSNAALIRGGIGGLLVAALFVTSTVINQISPLQIPYVTTTDYVNQAVLVLAFAAAVAAVVGPAMVLRRSGLLHPEGWLYTAVWCPVALGCSSPTANTGSRRPLAHTASEDRIPVVNWLNELVAWPWAPHYQKVLSW